MVVNVFPDVMEVPVIQWVKGHIPIFHACAPITIFIAWVFGYSPPPVRAFRCPKADEESGVFPGVLEVVDNIIKAEPFIFVSNGFLFPVPGREFD